MRTTRPDEHPKSSASRTVGELSSGALDGAGHEIGDVRVAARRERPARHGVHVIWWHDSAQTRLGEDRRDLVMRAEARASDSHASPRRRVPSTPPALPSSRASSASRRSRPAGQRAHGHGPERRRMRRHIVLRRLPGGSCVARARSRASRSASAAARRPAPVALPEQLARDQRADTRALCVRTPPTTRPPVTAESTRAGSRPRGRRCRLSNTGGNPSTLRLRARFAQPAAPAALLALTSLSDRRRTTRGAARARALWPPRRAAVVVDHLSKTFRLPHQRTRRSRSGRCTRSARARTTSCTPSTTSSSTIAAGRVLRHRRPQRLGQEHAAEVPRRDLPARQRRRSTSTGGCRRSSSSASASTPT